MCQAPLQVGGAAAAGEEYLTLQISKQLRAATPLKGAKLPGRNLRLMSDLTQTFREDPAAPIPSGEDLRNHAYSLRAEKSEKGVLRWLAKAKDVSFTSWPLTLLNDVIALFGEQVLYKFPRWCWGRWWHRRLLKAQRHNWYEQWRRLGKTDRPIFDWISELLTRQADRMAPHQDDGQRDPRAASLEAADDARQDLEALLLRALLADLHVRLRTSAADANPATWLNAQTAHTIIAVLQEAPGSPHTTPQDGETLEALVQHLAEWETNPAGVRRAQYGTGWRYRQRVLELTAHPTALSERGGPFHLFQCRVNPSGQLVETE